MKLRGTPIDDRPALSYVGKPSGTVVGGLKLPIGRILPVPGHPGKDGKDGKDGLPGEVTKAQLDAAQATKVDKTTAANSAYANNGSGDPVMRQYTAAATPTTIMYRDSSGNTSVATPAANGHAANKSYVDTQDGLKLDKLSTPGVVYVVNQSGNQASMGYADDASPLTLVRRASDGQVRTAAPTSDASATTKLYVDTAVATKQEIVRTGTVGTAAATATKTVTLDGAWSTHTPVAGNLFLLKFTLGQTASSPTININGKGAIALQTPSGSTSGGNMNIAANATVLVVYDGTVYRTMGALNSTPSTITQAEIDAGTSTSSRLVTPALLAYALTKAAPAVHTHQVADVAGLQAALDTKLNQAQVDARVQAGTAALVDQAPGTLDTLNELAAALGDDPNFATTITTQVGTKLDKVDSPSNSRAYVTTPTGQTTVQYSSSSVAAGTLVYRGTGGATAIGPGVNANDAVNKGQLDSGLAAKADLAHAHAIADVTGLQTALDAKAAASHTHTTSQVAGLDTALSGKANASHTHAVVDVTGLQTALDGKAPNSHTHTTAQVSGLDAALAAKADASALASKADASALAATNALLPIQVTQAQYDALGAGRPARLYAIVG